MLESNDHPGELVVRLPSFWQLIKAGAAFTLGAGLVTVAGAFFWMFIITGVIFGSLSSLSSAMTPRRAAPAPTISRNAPAPSSAFEQRVQYWQRQDADTDMNLKAIDEARRREKTSRK